VEFLKSLFKFSAIAFICLLLLKSEQQKVINAMFSDPTLVPELMLTMAMRLVSAISIATIVLVAADLIWARFKWHTDLKMTQQEVKDEYKQMEGDPMVKARMRSITQDRSRRRMLAAVPRASFVIANPTHYAIALRYERNEASAPIVVAKGKDLIALKIREIAEQSGVPVIEDKPLARSMYVNVEVDRMIPPDFYKAVAEILFFILTRSK
jgi:flagellar biosynthetic protein FlhB